MNQNFLVERESKAKPSGGGGELRTSEPIKYGIFFFSPLIITIVRNSFSFSFLGQLLVMVVF